MKHVWKDHGLPKSIVFDRGAQFIGDFWRFLCKKLGITVQLSIVWHTETDGQTERINGVMEQCVRSTIFKDDWPDWLAIAEFVGKSSKSETMKVTLPNKGFSSSHGL